MVTLNDRAVLDVVFNPELPTRNEFGNETNQVDNQTSKGESDVTLINVDPSLVAQVKLLEKESVVAAEAGNKSKSLEMLSQAIKLLPMKASLFNNRAQVLQLHGKTEEAISDLDEAIKLTNGKGSVAMNAYTQRAVIRIKLNGFGPENKEAINDLKSGEMLGSDFCKKLLVKFNPYSALCNSMLSSMMKELKG